MRKGIKNWSTKLRAKAGHKASPSSASSLSTVTPTLTISSDTEEATTDQAARVPDTVVPPVQNPGPDLTIGRQSGATIVSDSVASAKPSTAKETALNVIKLSLNIIGVASDNLPVPGLKLVTETLSLVIEKAQESSENAHGLRDLADRMSRLQPIFLKVQEVGSEDSTTVDLLRKLKVELESLTRAIQQASSHGTVIRFFNSTDDASSLKTHTATLDSIIGELTLSILLDAQQGIKQVVKITQNAQAIEFTKAQQELFNGLNRVNDAVYNSTAREYATGCLEGTRVDLLEKIHTWVGSPDHPLFWLNGVAGTGKSAIAHSVAEHYDDPNRRMLGASFFFSRDQKARRETRFLFQTLAFQLGNRFPVLKAEIATVLQDQTILASNMRNQLRRLVLDPISVVRNEFISGVVIVLDALDECEEDDAVSRTIELLVQEIGHYDLPLKLFVTSRPEYHLRTIFTSSEVDVKTIPLILHEVELSHVESDITLFVNHKLKKISDISDPHWPDRDDVHQLVKLSAGLFIAASTACKFIQPVRMSQKPHILLRKIVQKDQSTLSRQFEYLDQMYTQILEHAITEELMPDAHKHFRTIVGTIVLAYSRLTVTELAGLLAMSDEVEDTLAELHSVILVPEDDMPVHAFHLSFHDYLTDPARCTNTAFFINSPLCHAQILHYCLDRMQLSLKMDICNIQDLSKLNKDIDDMPQQIQNHIPRDLQYACQYWTLHLAECTMDENLVKEINSFVFKHILHWMEVLSLLGTLERSMISFKLASKKILSTGNVSDDLCSLLYDADRFMLEFYDVINLAALHVYYSALPFTPQNTLLHQLFYKKTVGMPNVLGTNNSWNICLRVINTHHRISSVAISHDGIHIVSGSNDRTIQMWDVSTGASLQELIGHSDAVNSVAISHDCTHIISGSDDKSIQIWDVHTGTSLHTLRGHSGHILSVAISHDDMYIVSGSADKTIQIWDAHTGASLQELIGHSDEVNSVVISHNDSFIVSGSDDKTIQIWDIHTGAALNKLRGHSGYVFSVAISHDDVHIISGSADQTVRIWNINTSACLHVLRGHSGLVSSVAISPDGTFCVSGSNDKTLNVWDVHTGKYSHELAGHSGFVHSVAISHDSTLIVSGSDDNTILIWDAQAGMPIQEIGRHWSEVNSVAISQNSTCKVVSGSDDKTIQIWDAYTDELPIHELSGHTGAVCSVAISHDGALIVSGSDDKTIQIWNAHTGALLHKLTGHSGLVSSVAISHDGFHIISGSWDMTIQIWDAHTGRSLHELTGHSSYVFSVAISHDGTLIVSGSDDNTIIIWDTHTGEPLHELTGHTSAVRSVGISHDGSHIVSGSQDKTIKIWDAHSGACLHSSIKASAVFDSVMFSLDGSLIQTNLGTYIIQSNPHTWSDASLQIKFNQHWFILANNRVVWVPPAYQHISALASSSSVLVLGTASGDVIIIYF